MLIVAFILVALAAYLLGFYHRLLWDKVKVLESNIASKTKAREEFEQPTSTFLDPDDVLQRARFEQAEIQRTLNPEQNES